jgi:phage shock protein E
MRKTYLILLLFVGVMFILCSREYSYYNEETGKTYNLNKITTEEFMKLDEEGKLDNYTIVDVRTEEEYNSGHIKNAILKPVDQINTIEDVSEFDKEKPVIVYCRTDNRSFRASKVFVKAKFETYYLLGGISELKDAGYEPIVVEE